MNQILSDIEYNGLICLARRTQGKPSFIDDSDVEMWFAPITNYDNFGLCLICHQEVCRDHALKHARQHLKERNLTIFL